jgi:hypothetical protein
MSQSAQIGEAWGFCRDTMKGESEADAYALAEIRRYRPRTMAEIMSVRAKAMRPEIVPAMPARDPRDNAKRADYNALQRYARQVRSAIRSEAPPEPNPAPPPPPCATLVKASEKSSAPRYDDKARKLKRDHMIAMSKMVYSDYQPSEEDIIYAFGSVAEWEHDKAAAV